MKSSTMRRAFTFVEIMVGLAIASIMTVGTVSYTSLARGSAELLSVEADSEKLNKALQAYKVGGGTLSPGLTAAQVVSALKSIPNAALAKETVSTRQPLPASVGLAEYVASDGRPRLLYSGGVFTVATTGDGYLLDRSGNIAVTTDNRRATGQRFASTSNWIWDYSSSGAPPVGGSGPAGTRPTVTLTTSAPVGGPTGYQIVTAGAYTFTATSSSTIGSLSLNVGPYSQTIAVSAGVQSVTATINIGPGANFNLNAYGSAANINGSGAATLAVRVNIPGVNTATPVGLAITGPDAVNLLRSSSPLTVPYSWTLTYSDGTIAVGPLSNASQGTFTWAATSGTSRSLSETRSGLTASKNVIVNYMPAYTAGLSVSPPGAGSASVTAPGGSQPFDGGATVTASATPSSSGWTFSGWTGTSAAGSNPYSFVLSANTSLVANFVLAQRALSVSAATGAIIINTPSTGVNGSGFPTFLHGTNVSVTAVPPGGSTFGAWAGTDGAAVSGGASGTILMVSDRAIAANFSSGGAPSLIHTLSVLVNDAAAGTPVGSIGAANSGSVYPTSVSLNSGWLIASVTVSGSGSSLSPGGAANNQSVTIGDSATTVTYNLVSSSAPTRSLTVAVDNASGGTPTGSVASAAEGGAYPTSVALNAGWTIGSVTVSGSGSTIPGGSANNQVVTIGSSETVVTYRLVAPPPTHTLSVVVNNPAGGSPSGSLGAASQGSNYPTSVSLNAGWLIGSVTVSGAGSTIPGGAGNNQSVTIGSAAAVVTYNLTQVTYVLTVNGGTGGGSYGAGAVASVSATVPPGQRFVNWSGTVADGNSPSTSVTVNADITVTATFAPLTATWNGVVFAGGGNGAPYGINVWIANSGGVSVRAVSGSDSGGGFNVGFLGLGAGDYTAYATVISDAGGALASPAAAAPIAFGVF